MMLAGFKSAVHDPCGMCRVECFSDLNAEPHGLGNGQWASAQPGRQRFAVQILHHEEVDAIVMPEVVERTDVQDARAAQSHAPRYAKRARPRVSVAPFGDRIFSAT